MQATDDDDHHHHFGESSTPVSVSVWPPFLGQQVGLSAETIVEVAGGCQAVHCCCCCCRVRHLAASCALTGAKEQDYNYVKHTPADKMLPLFVFSSPSSWPLVQVIFLIIKPSQVCILLAYLNQPQQSAYDHRQRRPRAGQVCRLLMVASDGREQKAGSYSRID